MSTLYITQQDTILRKVDERLNVTSKGQALPDIPLINSSCDLLTSIEGFLQGLGRLPNLPLPEEAPYGRPKPGDLLPVYRLLDRAPSCGGLPTQND
jgi:hypothetical protein